MANNYGDPRYTDESFVWQMLTDAIVIAEREPQEEIELFVKPSDIIKSAIKDSAGSIHYKYSPSKSVGWMECAAYMDRATQWGGSKEPAIRGTFAHYILERLMLVLGLAHSDGSETYTEDELTDLSWFVYKRPDLVSPHGMASVSAAITLADSVRQSSGFDWWVELLFTDDRITDVNTGKTLLGGSIDLLHIDPMGKHIRVYDLKTGKNKVHPKSWQLKLYMMLTVYNLFIRGNKTKEIMEILYHLGLNDLGDYHDFTFEVGVVQDGKYDSILHTGDDIDNMYKSVIIQESKIKRYEKLGLKMLKGTPNDEVECMKYPDLFEPNEQCRFCSGCYKRD